ncbi:MAG: MFS transporter, partial [Acidimicrobiaceae bacterium]|nr:MFS transporter [Acidimicrobiaceae bacterium]
MSRPNPTGPPPEPGASSRPASFRAAAVTPFVRLARTHAFHAAGEASVFVTLAGTLLTIDPNDARSRILLALVLTMAPFALVGPLIGPALDRVRGGRRATIALSLLLRAALMVLLIRNIDTAWFFPIAFIWLVLGKTYSVAKAATVPTTVHDEDELVDKNSRL